MSAATRHRLIRYGWAIAATLVALLLTFAVQAVLATRITLLLFFGAVAFSAGVGGLGAGLMATVLSVILVDYFLLADSTSNFIVLVLFGLVSIFISSLYQRRLHAETDADTQRESLRVTLLSIGDGVIVTDVRGKVTFLNQAAEALTGWRSAEAAGYPISDVFRIVNQETRATVDNPVAKVLEEKMVTGLANHTILIAKDGVERDIDDSAAPIFDAARTLTGVVLTFRDISDRRLVERRIQQASERTRRLQNVTAALGETILPEGTAKVIVEQTIDALDGAYGALVGTLIEDGKTVPLKILYSKGYSEQFQASFRQLPGNVASPFTAMVLSKQPVFVESKAAWKGLYPDQAELVTSEAVALLPLLIDSRAIGGMAVSFDKPHPFGEADRAFLISIARQCAQALDRTALYAEAEKARQDAIDTLDSIGDAFLALDSEWRITYINPKAQGLWPRSAEPSIGSVLWDIFPAAADTDFYIHVQRVGSTRVTFEYEQYHPHDDSWHAVRLYPSANGISAFFHNIMARKQAQSALETTQTRLQRFVDANIVGIIFATTDGHITNANDAFLNMVGYSRDDLTAGKLNWVMLTPTEYLEADTRGIEEVEQLGSTVPLEKEYIHKDGHRIAVLLGGALVEGSWITFAVNISDRIQAERRLRLLTEASTLLASSLDYQTTLRSLAQLVVPSVADWCTVHVVNAAGVAEQVVVAHKDPAKVAWAADIQHRYPNDPNARTGLYQVIRSGQAEFYPRITDAMLVAATQDPALLGILREIGYTSVMVVPLKVRERVLGALQLVSTESRREFTADDLALAEELALRAAIAVDNARLYGAMREQRERLQVTLTSIGDAVIATDDLGRVTFMNAVAQDLTGWTQTEAIDRPLEVVFHIINATSRETVESPVKKVIREGSIVGLANHTLLIAQDGTETPIDDSGAPIRGEDGAIEGVILVFRDVTERKRAEDDQLFLNRAGAILAASLDEVVTLDNLAHATIPHLADYCAIDLVGEGGVLRRVAVAATKPEKEAILRQVMGRYPPRSAQAIMQDVLLTRPPFVTQTITDEMITNVSQDAEEAELRRAIGARSLMRLPLIARERIIGLITVGMAESGRTYGAEEIALGQELIHIASLSLENARLYHEAREAIRARNEFLSVAAHELKTPVTSLRGFAQTLLRQYNKRGTVDPEQMQRALLTIDTQSTKLTKLVNQLLDLSRLEAGRLTLDRQRTDLSALINEVVGTMQKTTQLHHITTQMPVTLETSVDPLRLEQVLINLLDNAIKYSPRGGAIDVELSTPDAGHAWLSVLDHGIGIPVDRRDQIFERFYQAHRDGYMGGMGLGLYISRQIIDLHGGQLEAEFPTEGGTRLIITLPLTI